MDTISCGAICDGYQHCEDGSDETDCNMFKCNTGRSLARREVCNNDKECDEGEDELLSLCNDAHEFTCKSGEKSIPYYQRCDGRYECSDYSDEDECLPCPHSNEHYHPDWYNGTRALIHHCNMEKYFEGEVILFEAEIMIGKSVENIIFS